MLSFRNVPWLHCLVGMALAMPVLGSAVYVSAQQGNSAIAQQFQTSTSDITPASLVSIEKENPDSVELSSLANPDRLAGVVSNDPLIELSNGESGVRVVTGGMTVLLVSDLNGTVETGDKITASPILGVGMKATSAAVVVGTAQASLKNVQTESRDVQDRDGKTRSVKIGIVPVQVSVAFYSPDNKKDSAFVPPFLQSLANKVTGKNVSPVRVLVAALILLLMFLSITVLLYSSVRSSIISIGRNPLSESAVRKSLGEVGLSVAAVLVFAVVVVYLVLTV